MKRSQGDGSFRILPNGTIEYAVSMGTDLYGAPTRKRFYGFTQSDCRRKYQDYLKDIGAQRKAVSDYTLGQWLDEWLKSYKGKRIAAGENQIQQSTLDEYQRIADRIKKYKIASIRLTDVKPMMVSDLFNNLSVYSHTVIKKTRFLLNAAFNDAINNDLCYKNPILSTAIPQKAPGEKKVFSNSAVTAMTEFAKTDEFGAAMLLLLYAGLRSQELRAIGAKDINGRIVTIDKAIKETGELGVTKNRKPRIVPLPKDIIINCDPDCIYILGGNKYISKDALRSAYAGFFRRLNLLRESIGCDKIEPLPPHCCRHTYATRLRRNNVQKEIVSYLMGHNEEIVTQGYTHLDSIADLIKAIDAQGI